MRVGYEEADEGDVLAADEKGAGVVLLGKLQVDVEALDAAVQQQVAKLVKGAERREQAPPVPQDHNQAFYARLYVLLAYCRGSRRSCASRGSRTPASSFRSFCAIIFLPSSRFTIIFSLSSKCTVVFMPEYGMRACTVYYFRVEKTLLLLRLLVPLEVALV